MADHRAPLTATQAKVLTYMVKFLAVNDQLPHMAKIAEDFGWASTNAAHTHVSAMEKKGYLARNELGHLMLADRPALGPKICTWQLDDLDMGIWSSSCGELWSFIDGGPAANRVQYCHHCGGRAHVVHSEETAHG